jgi:hypothetical protein
MGYRVTGNMIDGYIAHDPDKTHVLAVSVAARSIPTPKADDHHLP